MGYSIEKRVVILFFLQYLTCATTLLKTEFIGSKSEVVENISYGLVNGLCYSSIAYVDRLFDREESR